MAAAFKIAVAFAVLSSILLFASAIRPLSSEPDDRAGQPLELTNDTVSTAHHLDLEGFRHVDLSLRRPFRHHGAPFFGFRHHHHHHDGGHRFQGAVVEPEGGFKKGYYLAEAAAETGEDGDPRKMAADTEEEEVKEPNPSFFHRHSHHFGLRRFSGGWVAKHEELKKKRNDKKMAKKKDSDSDSDSDDEAEGKEKEEKGGWLSWFKSIWNHGHGHGHGHGRCHHHHHHLGLHSRRHHMGHRSHRFHGMMVNPEGDETMSRTWLTAHLKDAEGHREMEKEEEVKEIIMEQPKTISEEAKEAAGVLEEVMESM